jgi:alpha-L-rhamnosidase
MRTSRREFLALSGASVVAGEASTNGLDDANEAHLPATAIANTGNEWNGEWIWYPGQLAAYRHSRRIRLALSRCAFVGYPANFRQPLTEVYFRKSGTAVRDTPLRWAGSIARIRTTIGGRGGDITTRQGVLRAGESNIEVQINFLQGLPCLLLEGGEFSTGPSWQASLDGEHWVRAETCPGGDHSGCRTRSGKSR